VRLRGGMIGIVAASLLARTTLVEVGSKIHDSRYHVLCYLSSTNKVFILSMLPRRSNGRVRERKQRGRSHWGGGKCWKVDGGREREVIFKL
jgi:hypothetical protein